LEYIASTSEEKIILIIESFSENYLSILEGLKQVEAVILFTFLSYDTLLSRIYAHYQTEEELVDQINSICENLTKQMIVFSIYNQQNKEKRGLTHKSGSFLFFSTFQSSI
jgi:hypothetical protein